MIYALNMTSITSHDANWSVGVAGPTFLDIVMCGLEHPPCPGEEQWVSDCRVMPGGAANQAVASARLGMPVSLITYLGNDLTGTWVRDMLRNEHVDLTNTATTERQNITVAQMFEGDRAFTSFGNDTVPAPPADMAAPKFLLCSLDFLRDNRRQVQTWREQGTLVITDVGWDSSENWNLEDLEPLSDADIFVPNHIEACNYAHSHNLNDAGETLLHYVDNTVITCGEKGIYIASRTDTSLNGVSLPSLPTEVIDTTGAGDSFSAGLVAGLASGTDVLNALQFGQCVAAWTVNQIGGSGASPTPSDLKTWSQNRADIKQIIDPILANLITQQTRNN